MKTGLHIELGEVDDPFTTRKGHSKKSYKITIHMEKLGKSKESIQALEGRVRLLQEVVAKNPTHSISKIYQYIYSHYNGKP